VTESLLLAQPSDRMHHCRRWLSFVGVGSLALLLLTPLIMDPGAHDDAYMGPKWAWLAIWSGMLLAAVAGRALTGRPVMFPFDAVWIAALAFMAWHWIALAWARSPSLGVDRAARVTWLTLALLGSFQWLRNRRDLAAVGALFVGVGAVTALWILVEDALRAWWPELVYLKSNLADWRGFLAAGLGNTNHVGDLLALTLLTALAMVGEARRRAVRALLAAALVLIPAALIVCFSAGSNLGLVCGALVLLAGRLRRGGAGWFVRRRGLWLALVAAWAALIVFFCTDHPLNPHRPGILAQGFGSARWQAGGPTRLAIWAQSLEMIRQRSLLGFGPGNFTYVFPEMDSALIADRPDLLVYQGMWTNAAHNVILQMWTELGVVGLFLFLTLVCLALYQLLKGLPDADEEGATIRLALLALLTAWLVQGQVNFVSVHPSGLLTFYVLLAAVIAEKRARPRAGGAMPSLRYETGPLALQLDWHSMKKPTGLGLAVLLPDGAAIALSLLLVCVVLFWAPRRVAPVLAQRAYRAAVQASQAGAAGSAEEHFRRALRLDPDAQDVRSRFSVFLLEQNRPEEALAEIARVRERLNSNELWAREAQALAALGREQEAVEHYETYLARVWSARNPR